jgi:hypothetical protein
MNYRLPPRLDMTPDGQFREPRGTPVAAQIGRWALVVAVVAGAFGLAALALWLALSLIPIAIVAGLLAWLAFRFRLWQVRGSFRGSRDITHR